MTSSCLLRHGSQVAHSNLYSPVETRRVGNKEREAWLASNRYPTQQTCRHPMALLLGKLNHIMKIIMSIAWFGARIQQDLDQIEAAMFRCTFKGCPPVLDSWFSIHIGADFVLK